MRKARLASLSKIRFGSASITVTSSTPPISLIENESLIIDKDESDSQSIAISYGLDANCEDGIYIITDSEGNVYSHEDMSTSINMCIADMTIDQLESI